MQTQQQLFRTLLVLCLTLALTIPPVAIQAQAEGDEPTISFETLSNLTYFNEYSADEQVTLENGQYEEDDPAIEGTDLLVTLTGYVAYGDLNGDALEDAAVVLETDTAGTGRFYELAVVIDEEGTLTNVATTLLGDRVQLNDVAIVDGQIIIDMITQGPGDAACCPTREVQQIYGLAEDALTLVSEEAVVAEDAAPAGTFAPAADPTTATLYMGGADAVWLDPMLVSVHSGSVTGAPVDAGALGEKCTGTIDERPEVVLNWEEDETVETLRIFFLSMGDPTLLVVTPEEEVLCSDDLNPLMLDPYLEIADPTPGRYAIYLGSFEGDVTTPGFLVVTSQEFNPATLDIAQMFPRTINPGAVGESLALDVLDLDGESTVAPVEALDAETVPYTTTLVAGGELGAYNIELDNDQCTGFIDATPTFAFDWAGEADDLVLFFEADADTTLVVRDPAGAFQCNDDADGAKNLNPYLALTPIEGSYTVWVGGFEPTTLITGTLTIAGGAELQPAALPAGDSGD